MKIADRLREIRLEHDMTQKQLSATLNIGQATIACYENGKREPHLSILIAYADFFGCSLDYLAGRTDDLGNPITPAAVDLSKTTDSGMQFILYNYYKLSDKNKAKLGGYLDGLLAATNKTTESTKNQ